MRRFATVFASAAFFSLLIAPGAFAQKATPATPKANAPAAPARWVVPIKGKAAIELIEGQSKKVGSNVVTPLKIKNTSGGAIALLRVDEYWYDKGRQTVSAGSNSYRQPFMPNQVIDLDVTCPYNADGYQHQFMFSHANGTISPKVVKKFSDK